MSTFIDIRLIDFYSWSKEQFRRHAVATLFLSFALLLLSLVVHKTEVVLYKYSNNRKELKMMMGRRNKKAKNDEYDDDDNDVVVASSSSTFVRTLMNLPMTARLDIWNFLGETQEEMRTFTLISKQTHVDSKHSGIEWQLLPVIEISPTKGGSTEQLFHSLLTHHTNNDRHNNKQTTSYRTMTVNDMHKFNKSSGEWKFTNIDIQLDRITSLNISSLPSGTTRCIGNCYYFPYYLANILPNLLALDLSHTIHQSWFNHGTTKSI